MRPGHLLSDTFAESPRRSRRPSGPRRSAWSNGLSMTYIEPRFGALALRISDWPEIPTVWWTPGDVAERASSMLGHRRFGALDGCRIRELDVQEQVSLVLLRHEAGRGVGELAGTSGQQPAVHQQHDRRDPQQPPDRAAYNAMPRRTLLNSRRRSVEVSSPQHPGRRRRSVSTNSIAPDRRRNGPNGFQAPPEPATSRSTAPTAGSPDQPLRDVALWPSTAGARSRPARG